MALPTQFKTARITGSSSASGTPGTVAAVEAAIVDALGYTLDTNITESAFTLDNSGRITKALLRQVAAGPVGHRFRDSTAGKEFRLVLSGTDILVDENTGTESVPVWTNRTTSPITAGLGGGGANLYSSINSSAAINNTIVETAFNKSYTIPANTIVAGDVFRVNAAFTYAGSAAIVILRLRLGGTALFLASISTNSGTEVTLEGLFAAKSIGASASIQPGYRSAMLPTGAATTSGITPVTRDTTGTLAVDISAQWDIAAVGNTITMVHLSVGKLSALSTS